MPKARKGESSHPHTPCLSSCSPRCYFLLRDRHIQPPIPGCPPLTPETQAGILPPSPDLFLFWRQEAEGAKDLTPSLLLPASLPLHSGQPQLLILERPRHRELRQTTNQQAPHPCNGSPAPPNSSISRRNLAWDKAREGLGQVAG